MNNLIERYFPENKITLVEASKDGLKLRFEFAKADEKNLNGRTYPHKVLATAVKLAQTRLAEGESLYGTLGHKDNSEVEDVSHRLLKLFMEDKSAFAEAAVLGTSKGKNLAAIITSGGTLGASMHGEGDVVEGVVEKFVLRGVDIVLAPSFSGARISQDNIFESAAIGNRRDPETDKSKEPEFDEEARLSALYLNACAAGFLGSKKDYRDMIFRPKAKK